MIAVVYEVYALNTARPYDNVCDNGKGDSDKQPLAWQYRTLPTQCWLRRLVRLPDGKMSKMSITSVVDTEFLMFWPESWWPPSTFSMYRINRVNLKRNNYWYDFE